MESQGGATPGFVAGTVALVNATLEAHRTPSSVTEAIWTDLC